MNVHPKLRPLDHERTTWLVLCFLLIGVLVPTASVLWFINEAARSEAAAARQSVMDAYRGRLPLIRGRIDSFWSERGRVLAERGANGRPADFKKAVTEGLADSVILLDDRGAPAYPAPDAYSSLGAGQEPSPAARAARADIRSLVQAGDKEAAIRAIERHFANGPAARGIDPQGRLIAADEWLLSLQLVKRDDHRVAPIRDRLAALLNDYDSALMPSAQRLFLMTELRTLTGDSDRALFPTFEAERLAETFLETDATRIGDDGFQRSRMSDVWAFTPNGGRIVALYKTGTILALLNTMLEQQNASPGARFAALSPGSVMVEDSISAGTLLPDWRIAFSLADRRPLHVFAGRRVATYAWAGSVIIAMIAVCALLIGRSFQRQLNLTRLKTDLVAAVSHELKTPLSSMRLLVDSLLDDGQLDPAKTREYLQLIASENLRLSRLIDNFLTFSRIERNRERFEFADIDATHLAALAVEAMRERLSPSACQFTVEIEANLPPIRADENALLTAILNLLDNAYKYTPIDKQIALKVYRDESRVVFVVRDNGIGIDTKDQKRIFRRFYQVDRRLARERGGCGLGLSIVDFIARGHGGTIRVTSQPGAGSTFMLSLPGRVQARGAAA